MDKFTELASILRSIHANIMVGEDEVCAECDHLAPCTTRQAIEEIEQQAHEEPAQRSVREDEVAFLPMGENA